jgi:uncharacterized protein (DUF1778 family)
VGDDGESNPVAATSRKERLDLRVSADHKRLIEQAATLSGLTVSSFILDTIMQRAREVVRETIEIELTIRDRDRFLAALGDANAKPSAALRRAAQRHKKLLG